MKTASANNSTWKVRWLTVLPTIILAICATMLGGDSQGAMVTLGTLTDNEMVGLNDTNSAVAPAAVGDGWFTGAYMGTARARTTTQTELKTQWYFRFDISALSGILPSKITSAKLNLPQIGRLNTVTDNSLPLRVFDVNAAWDDDGGNYPTWNLGREAPFGTPGGTLLKNFGNSTYQTFGTTADTSNTNVEGVFVVDTAALLATVQSWQTSPTNNEGFLVTFVGQGLAGLAFGPPTLELTVVPEPSTWILGSLGMLGVVAMLRRRRKL